MLPYNIQPAAIPSSEEQPQAVMMTAEEQAEFAAFREAKARKEAEERARNERAQYRQMVDDEIARSIPILRSISDDIRRTKSDVMESFRTIIEMKKELFRTKVHDGQLSHTFTNSDGNMRITLGQYVTDDYRDTVEEGIAIVKEYITSLAADARSEALVSMVMRLLSRDAQGTLKASRIVQLRRVAEETGDARFMEGVRIIEEAYQPAASKQYIRAEQKNAAGVWMPIPLGMTEC